MRVTFVVIPGEPADIEELVATRKRSGMSVSAAATTVGVHRSTLLRWERGERPMPEDVYSRLADIYAERSGLAEQLIGAVGQGEALTMVEWRRQLDSDGRRVLRNLLVSGRLMLAGGVRTDAAGRRYVRQVVYVRASSAARGLDRSAPAGVSGAQLRSARRFAGMTVDGLASRVGLSSSSIRAMEASPAVPRGRIDQLVAALGLVDLLTPDRLRATRNAARWSQREVAQRVGVTLGIVHNWETSRRPVPVGRMVPLAAAMFEAATTSPGALAARRRDVLGAILADVTAHPGTTSKAVLHRRYRHRQRGTAEAAEVLTDALRSHQLVEVPTTTGDGRGRRTVLGLYLPADVPCSPAGGRLTGDQLSEKRYQARATQRQVAESTGASAATVTWLESRGRRPVPLHWEGPLRTALGELRRQAVSIGTPDDRAHHAILSQLETQPGMAAWRLHRDVRRALGATHGKEKASTRALRELMESGDVVLAESADALGRRFQGLYRREDAPRAPATVNGSVLRQLRRGQGWTTRQLAVAIGVSAGRVARWERGERRCPPEWLAAIRAALAGPAPLVPGRQLRHLLALAAAPGGVAVGVLPASFFTPRGQATVSQGVRAGMIHAEERLVERSDGRIYVRSFLVPGPEGDSSHEVIDRMTGSELRRLRVAAGLTQVALGERIGSPATTVSGWETGRVPIPPGRVAQLRSALAGAVTSAPS